MEFKLNHPSLNPYSEIAIVKKQLERSIVERNRLDYSNKSNIYCVNNSLVAKMGRSNELNEREFDVGNYLYENGIHVPRIHSLIKINRSLIRNHMLSYSFDNNLVLLMQRIPGKRVDNLEGNEFTKAHQLMKKELAKTDILMIYPSDVGTHNTLYNPNDGKVYLIDFEGWEWK